MINEEKDILSGVEKLCLGRVSTKTAGKRLIRFFSRDSRHYREKYPSVAPLLETMVSGLINK